MRTALFAATALFSLLAACRGQEASQANDAAANISGDASPPATAQASAVGATPLGDPVSGDRAKQLMHERHEGMEDIGDAMKVLTREMKKDSPNPTAVRPAAGTIANLSPRVSGWFPPGTGPDAGKTHAKPEIWQKPDDFAAKVRAFQQAAQAFNAAAQGSDMAGVKAAHADLGKSCKACHDLYRAEDKE